MIEWPAVVFPVVFDGKGLVDAEGKRVVSEVDMAEVARRANAYEGYVAVIKAAVKSEADKLEVTPSW